LRAVFHKVFVESESAKKKTKRKRTVADPMEVNAECSAAYSEQMGRWAADVMAGISSNHFFWVMHLMQRLRAPLDHLHLFMMKRTSDEQMEPSPLALLVWGKGAEIQRELTALCDMDLYMDFIDKMSPATGPKYYDFILKVACEHLSDYEMRVLQPLGSMEYQILWLAKSDPEIPCGKRRGRGSMGARGSSSGVA
jgi:hypothetical protein